MDRNLYNEISYYTDIIIFSIVFTVQLAIFVIRRFKIDTSATITLSVYLAAQFSRFLRSLLDPSRESPISLGVTVICTTVISMSMVHFVFEMQTVRITGDERRMQHFKITKAILIAFLITHAIIFDFTRLVWDFGRNLGIVGELFMVLPGCL